MGAAIDAARQTADDDQASIGEVSCQPLCHLIPVGSRTTRADDGNYVAIQKFNVSADIQEGWRVVNLAKTLRVLRLVPGEQANSSGLSLGQFFRSGAHGLAAMDHLRDGWRQAVGLQLIERGVENG